jgi:hypothetical protein
MADDESESSYEPSEASHEANDEPIAATCVAAVGHVSCLAPLPKFLLRC